MIKFYYILLISSLSIANAFAIDLPVRRQAVKTTLLSWYTGSCKVSYERAVLSNQTMEITAGYIGVGHDKFKNNPSGYTARYAHKFILFGNDVYPLNGFFLRPELIYTFFHYDRMTDHERARSKMGSLVFTVGYQYAVHRIIADFFIGNGCAFGNEADTNYQHGFALWNCPGGDKKIINMTFGVKLGFSF